MDEYKLTDIWNKNLREFGGVMRLDSIIVRAMAEAVHESTKQGQSLPIDGVVPCGDCSTKNSPCRSIGCKYNESH